MRARTAMKPLPVGENWSMLIDVLPERPGAERQSIMPTRQRPAACLPAMTVPSSRSETLAPAEEEAECRAEVTLAEVRGELLTYLRKRLGDRELASDLTQEAILRMMKSPTAAEIEDRRAMLFRIAHNLVLEHRRSEYRHHSSQHVSIDEVAPIRTDHPAMEEMLDASQAIDQLLTRTISQLPPKCRLAFMLNRFDGLTYPQVAARMRISTKMVEKHVARALAACRLAVGDRGF
jgi:RNA polymerase sigma-70 factor (ECF subfamily)